MEQNQNAAANAIAKTLAETGNNNAQALLTNSKAQGYWVELMNATTEANAAMKNADANTRNADANTRNAATNEKMYENDKVRAAAMKLATEWKTGEFTNWKTWVDTSCQGINTIGNAVKNISELIPEKKVLGGAVKSAQKVSGFGK